MFSGAGGKLSAGAALLAMVSGTVFVNRDELREGAPAPERSPVLSKSKVNVAADTISPRVTLRPERLNRPRVKEIEATPFDPPPPPVASASASRPPPPPPPPPPQAPPLPFKFAGRMIVGSVLKIFVTKGDDSYTLGVGDILDSLYRVEEVNQQVVRFRYLPLDTVQDLNIESQ